MLDTKQTIQLIKYILVFAAVILIAIATDVMFK